MDFRPLSWEARFECGIALIDVQHQRLVQLVNRLSLVREEHEVTALPAIVTELRGYAQYHFAAEEQIWRRGVADAAERDRHERSHAGFVEQIETFRMAFAERPLDLARALHAYLCSWLVSHILGDDQHMARTSIAAGADVGASPKHAPSEASEALLLGALQSMDRGLSTANARLRTLNLELEQRVQERTRELQALLLSEQEARREAEAGRAAMLREHELRMRLATMLERMGEGFVTIDRDWTITYVNAEAERLCRATRAELVGRNVWEAFPEGRGSAFEAAHQRVLRYQVPVRLLEHYAPLDLWSDTRVFPTDEGLAIYFRDVSHERELEEQVRQAQRLESLGQITGGVAHDFNNLLTVVLGNAEMLTDKLEHEPRLQPLARMIQGAALRGAELTRALLAFARRQPLDPRAVDLNARIVDLQDLLGRALGEHVAIQIETASELPPALVDPAQFENALLNLCLNARDAMPAGGRLVIETAQCTLAADAQVQLPLPPGSYLVVSVSDNGVGIAPEHLAQVFEPFFTTKDKGKGTGLGLSMVYGFAKQSGGHVSIESALGTGTTVRIYLPRAANDVAEAVPDLAQRTPSGGRECILLVEDDVLVRRYAGDQLAALGYRVLQAGDGPEALEILRAEEDIDLLFTDIVMPGGMNGRQLADAALALRPRLKVLYTSGYTDNAVVHDGRLDPGVLLLNKPYRRAELALTVRAALDRAPDEGSARAA